MITQDMAKKAMQYDPETGIFVWKEAKRGRSFKKPVGCMYKDGYISINFNYKDVKAHRLAWLYVYGEWPKGDIDHINGIRSDNRICNLRAVSRRENLNNMEKHRQGRLPGTCFDKHEQKWKSSITINNRKKHIGNFNTEKEAHIAYMEYKNKMFNV